MRRLLAAAGIGALGALGTGLLGVARIKGLALVLGPSEFGVYGQVWTFVLYAGTVAALGFGVGTTRFVAEACERGDDESLATTLALSVAVPILTGVVVMVATIALVPWLGPALLGSHAALVLVLAAVSIPLVAAQNPLQHAIQGFQDVLGQNVAYLVYGAAFTGFSLVGALTYGVTGAVAALTAGNLVLVWLYLARTRTLLRRMGSTIRWVSPRHMRFGASGKTLLRIGAASLGLTAAFSASDLLIRSTLLHTSGKAVTGLWFALLQISIQFIGILAGTVSYYTAPALSRAVVQRDADAIRSVVDGSLRLTMLTVIPVILSINALRHLVVHVLFGPKFSALTPYMPAQMSGDILRTLGWVVGSALVPLGLTRQWVAIGVSSSLAYGAIGEIVTSRTGLSGAVGSYVLLWALALLGTAWIVIRHGCWAPTARTGIAIALTATGLACGTLWPGVYGELLVFGTTCALGGVVVHPNEYSTVLTSMRVLIRRLSAAS